MIMPHDLRAQHVETVAKMAASEFAALELPPAMEGRLAALLAGLVDAAGLLREELALCDTPAQRPAARSARDEPPCQVIEMRSRRRLP